MSLSAYWISNLIFDIFKGLIPSAIIIGLIYAYDLGWNNSWVMFLLYPFGVIPFSYVTSFLFSTENVAQSFTIFFHFVFAAFGPILIFILKIIDSTLEVGIILRWVFKIVPSFCLTDTILYDSSKTRLFLIRPQLKKDSDFDMTLLGGNILLLCMHFLIWIFMLLLIENGVFNCFAQMINILRKNRIAPKKEEELDQDEDVIMEEKRVNYIKPEELKIRVSKFRKVYPSLFRKPALAVERTSFGLEYGECFALLGVNGAGKSTTFKALTNEIEPSGGEISINGFNLQS
jgi:ATP-binding cassette subfamily A (ABC1) protein 3